MLKSMVEAKFYTPIPPKPLNQFWCCARYFNSYSSMNMTHINSVVCNVYTWIGNDGKYLWPLIATVFWNMHTHPFNGPLSRTTQVSRYQKGNTNLDFTEARDSEWQWHQLGLMQVCTSLQTDNHANTSPLSYLQAGCPSCRPTNSVKALKAKHWRLELFSEKETFQGYLPPTGNQVVLYTVKVVVSQKWCKIDTLLLHTTNRKYPIAYRFVLFPVTLSDLVGHWSHSFNSDLVCRMSFGDSWTSCCH